MLGGLTGWHLLIILAVILLIFGATRLPALAKGVGQSMRVFKKEIKPELDDVADRATADIDVDEYKTNQKKNAA
jgi:sec-independent protein translocase protein TatA